MFLHVLALGEAVWRLARIKQPVKADGRLAAADPIWAFDLRAADASSSQLTLRQRPLDQHSELLREIWQRHNVARGVVM